MKKILIVLILAVMSAPCAIATNILLENQRYKYELDKMAGLQKQENSKQTLYYKGKPDYVGTTPSATKPETVKTSTSASSTLGERKTYKKKGVRFKVDKDNQITAKNAPKKLEQTSATKYVKKATSATKTKSSEMTEEIKTKKHHNEDAE